MKARIVGVSGTLLCTVDLAGADRTSFAPRTGQKLPRTVPNCTQIAVGADSGHYDLLRLWVGRSGGTAAPERIVALSRWLAERYPDLFLGIRTAYNRGSDPRHADDEVDMACDTPPLSLRTHHTYYNPVGDRVWADAVTAYIRRKGWFQGGKP